MSRSQTINRWGVIAGAAAVLSVGPLTAYVANPGLVDDLTIPTRIAPDVRGSVVAELRAPPFVPAAIERDYPTKVIVNLEVTEKEMEIADGTTYSFWTFGGTVPGTFSACARATRWSST